MRVVFPKRFSLEVGESRMTYTEWPNWPEGMPEEERAKAVEGTLRLFGYMTRQWGDLFGVPPERVGVSVNKADGSLCVKVAEPPRDAVLCFIMSLAAEMKPTDEEVLRAIVALIKANRVQKDPRGAILEMMDLPPAPPAPPIRPATAPGGPKEPPPGGVP